jgi:hypothetical protein
MKQPIAYLLLALALAFTGCESSSIKRVGLQLAGYEAAKQAIEHNSDNADVVRFVATTIDAVLVEKSIAFEAVEDWYEVQRIKLDMDPIYLATLEQIAIIPLWQRLKIKYGGTELDLVSPEVRSDILAFKSGLLLAL